jgi:hypothetical protein
MWQQAIKKAQALRKQERTRLVGERKAAIKGLPSIRERREAATKGEFWCARCRQFLPRKQFGSNRGKADGRTTNCKPCYSLYIHERQMRKVFGITTDTYNAISQIQGGRCAICQHQPRKMRLAVDHDHKTGMIRGLLCRNCNQKILGSVRDSLEVLRRAVAYLENPPAADLALRVAA